MDFGEILPWPHHFNEVPSIQSDQEEGSPCPHTLIGSLVLTPALGGEDLVELLGSSVTAFNLELSGKKCAGAAELLVG